MLELLDVRKSFAGTCVIESASLSLAAGEVLCLSGPSGIGKTTLLEIAAGVTRPDGGTVTRRAKAALMFQDDVLIPWLTAREAVTFILPASMPAVRQEECAAHWLGVFGLEGGTLPQAMSGGMRRRLSLARTFAANRPLVLLDEPFAFLDADRSRRAAEAIAQHARNGGAVLLTSHDTAPLDAVTRAGAPVRRLAAEHSPIIFS